MHDPDVHRQADAGARSDAGHRAREPRTPSPSGLVVRHLGLADCPAVKVIGDETRRTFARELVDTVKQNVTIDWTVKESFRVKLRVIVKRILRKYGYPPDKQKAATNTVLQRAELLSDSWTKAAAS